MSIKNIQLIKTETTNFVPNKTLQISNQMGIHFMLMFFLIDCISVCEY